jgi:hypothetical protein
MMEANISISSPEKVERLTPKDLVRKHIADPTHQITEEEFNKLIVGVFANEPLLQKQVKQ